MHPRRGAGAAALLAAVALALPVVPAGATPKAGSGSPTHASPVLPAPGCGHRPVPDPRSTNATPTGDVVQTLRVGTVTRTYRLAVPNRYRPRVPTPLILLFHGSGSNAVETSIYTQLPKRASRAGFLVATPDAVAGSWQLSAPGAPTADLEFVSALIGHLASRYCVDPSRRFATGISLGSEFAAIVGCDRRDRIAALGLVAAEFLLRPCSGPIPVIAFHGTADPVVAYRSGATGSALPGIPVTGVEQNMAHWAALDRCTSGPHQRRVATRVVRRTWTGCAGRSSVVLYSVLGGGHTWPGSPITLSTRRFGPTTHQVDATGLILAFFDRHRLAGR